MRRHGVVQAAPQAQRHVHVFVPSDDAVRPRLSDRKDLHCASSGYGVECREQCRSGAGRSDRSCRSGPGGHRQEPQGRRDAAWLETRRREEAIRDFLRRTGVDYSGATPLLLQKTPKPPISPLASAKGNLEGRDVRVGASRSASPIKAVAIRVPRCGSVPQHGSEAAQPR